jgi:methylase of polypeptide subunit release factors
MLNRRQREQIARQVREHKRHTRPYPFPIEAAPGLVFSDFKMLPGVMQPLSSRYFAQFLFQNPKLFLDKTVVDVGSGSGILGVVCAIQGARRVVLSDVSPYAVKNSVENVRIHKVESRCAVVRGDLFERIESRADVILFAQPYFPGRPIDAVPATVGMLDEGGLIHRFFEQAKDHSRGFILMPYLEWVGPVNNPRVQAPSHGYRVETVFSANAKGLQQGRFYIYKLTLRP